MSIQAPAGVIWEGEIRSLRSHNQEGPFTILPDHANFMTPLHQAELIVTFADGVERSYTYEESVLFLEDNHIRLYVHEEPGLRQTASAEVATESVVATDETETTS